ncbi:hypothetical protein PENTCL1PPCAC_5879 [Pristionchus entomophagus]|uniref:Uncharacterized protein n=1 Tax=Pristionchus entomophagus TaxID=358040 RepID=A0AAV5SLD3_9BILA|nr:hypothetical protein PENTCL1PPCAC_5879 [Pristionchus entomophagus]
MTRAIGIDLGTTFTCVAYMETGGVVEVVDNDHGNKITPSVVHFGAEVTKVGEGAVAMRGKDPKNTIFQVKRFMGRDADDEEIQKRNYPFEVIGSIKGIANVRVKPISEGEAKVYCPEQISGDIIRYVKTLAEESIGEKVTEAVITVPANFTIAQRQATVDAGEIAGLKVLRIVNEPTAAALAYGFDKKDKTESRVILVYDLGGGTFDVSIVKMKGTDAEVKATRGLTYLGGEDFDDRIYNEAVAKFRSMDIDVTKECEFALLQSCEQAKRTLSTCDTAEIEMFDATGKRENFTITRDTFEELCQDLFVKTIDCVQDAIKVSGYKIDEIDDVVLVGGSSRIPRVQELLQKVFSNKKLKFDIPPDHAVAHGAAILAASLSQEGGAAMLASGGGEVKLTDVTPFTLGVNVKYDRMSVLIKRGTRYPTESIGHYENASDDQTSVCFKIYEGEFAVASQNIPLGKLEIKCPPKPIGENKIEVTFTIDGDGILQVHAMDEDTGEEKETKVVTSKLTVTERNKMKREAKNRAEQEAIQEAKMEARTAFADALMSVKTSIRRMTDADKQKEMRKIVEREEKWIDSRDPSNEELNLHAKGIREELSKLK